jgi:hypothetical protein
MTIGNHGKKIANRLKINGFLYAIPDHVVAACSCYYQLIQDYHLKNRSFWVYFIKNRFNFQYWGHCVA